MSQSVNGKSDVFQQEKLISGANCVAAFIACAAYVVIGPSLILLNKHILDKMNFPYPIFLSGLGVVCSAIAARIMVALGYVSVEKKDAVSGKLWYRRVLPVGLAHALSLSTGNAVYLLLNVGFIQMLKSFTPVIVMIFLYLAGVERPSKTVVMSIFVISIGTAATCSFTLQLSMIGLLVMFISEGAEAVRLVLTQFLLKNLKFGIIEGLYVLAPASAFWLMTASFVLEYKKMISANAFNIIFDNPVIFLSASFMGLGVNYLSYLVIQYTSSLTMKVLSTIRNIGIIFIGVALYGEVVTTNQALGYTVALAGFIAYNAAQMGFWTEIPCLPQSSVVGSFNHEHESDVESSASKNDSIMETRLLLHKEKDDRDDHE